MSQTDSFLKMYGAKGADNGKGLVVLGDGGYAICGTGADSSGMGSKMILIVTDQYGNVKDGFPKYYPEGNQSAGANAIVAKDGGNRGFLLSGFIEDASGDRDIFIVKTDADGDVNWSRNYGSSEDEEALHAAEGVENEFILAGYQEKQGEKDIMIMLVDQNGDSIDLSLFYTKPEDSKDAAATFILNAGDHYMCVATYNKFVGEGTDILVLNFDDDLSPNDKVLEGPYDEFGKCIIKQGENEFLVLGNSNNTQSGNSEILLYQVDSEGLLIKNDRLLATITQDDVDLEAERLVKMEDGRHAIIGTRDQGGNPDIMVQFLSDLKEDFWKTYGSGGTQEGADIAIPDNGGLVFIGDNGFDGNSMISLIKTNKTGDL